MDKRKAVEYFVSDMWQPYTDLATALFKNSILIIDKYHFIRQMIWAFESVRKSEQKKYGKENRISGYDEYAIVADNGCRTKEENIGRKVSYRYEF